MVVETMEKEHLSIYAAMQEFGINDHKIIERWEQIYLTEGPEGLAIERRGRGSKGRPPKQVPKQVEEDLLAEVQRLRADSAVCASPPASRTLTWTASSWPSKCILVSWAAVF